MANTLLTAEQIINTYLGILQREIVLPRVVTLRPLSDFTGAKDDTVSLRIPAVLTAREYEWRTRTNPIVVDDLTQTKVDVTLDSHPYSAVAVTDEELTLDISDFGQQVLQPQVRAVAEELENIVAGKLTAGTYQTTVDYAEGTDDAFTVLLAARKALNVNNVPMNGRILLAGADVERALLSDDRISKAQNAGDNIASTALADATVARVAGFTIVTSNAIPEDEAYALHPTAVVMAMGAPAVPDGVAFGQRQTYAGLAMRWIRDYDPNYLRDRSVVSAFAGATLVADGPDAADVDTNPDVVRAVKINFTAAA